MTITDNERRQILESFAARRAILKDDPASFFIDVAEACLQEYHEKTANSLALFERRLQDSLNRNMAEFDEVKKASKQIATALADLTRRVNSMDPAKTMAKIVQETYEKECTHIAYRSTERSYAYARQLYEKELDRSVWGRGKPVFFGLLVVVMATIFGACLAQYGVLR